MALQKLRENAEQHEKTKEAEFFSQMISLLTRIQDRLVLNKQSETSCPVPVPADFCCGSSGEVKGEPLDSSGLNGPDRSQTIRRRLSDRVVLETRADLSGVESQVRKLVEDLKSDSIDSQRKATSQLKLLAKHNMDNRIIMANSGAIAILVNLLQSTDSKTQENAATALYSLSVCHKNKPRVVSAGAVKRLVELMDPAGGMVDKAVAVLANLATIPEGRAVIGEEGAVPLLVEAVELGSARGKENAAAALWHLCTNSGRLCSIVVQEGTVPPVVALSRSGTPRTKEKAQALIQFFRSQRHANARG